MTKKLVLAFAILTTTLFGASEISFPANFKSFKSVSTTLTGIGALPGCDADVHSLPAIYQETVSDYCAVKPGGPGAVGIIVSPSALKAFKKRDGKFKDGDTLILWLKDIKALFVTEYKGGKPMYGAFTEDGKDIADAVPNAKPADCRTCHTGYAAFCVNGQCGTQK